MLILCVSLLVLFAQTSDVTRPPQTQAETPRFEDYPVEHIFRGKPAKVDFPSYFPQHDFFKLSIQDLIDGGVNFAGRYAIREWSCGTNCRWLVILDMKTGKFLKASHGALSLTEEQLHRQEHDWLQFRAHSRLLIATGCFDVEGPKKPIQCGAKYFKLENQEFVLIKYDPIPTPAYFE